MLRILRTVFLGVFCLSTGVFASMPAEKIKDGQTFKILHVMSFHSPWSWTDDQFSGFKDALKDIKVEYKVIQLNAKKNNAEQQEKIGNEAIALINTWKPDLVYTSDDVAQQFVTKKMINRSVPFVFSAVNKTPKYYGFDTCKNVAGVLEQEHYVPTVKLIQKIVPGVKKIAIMSDDDEGTFGDVYKRIAEKTPKELPGITIVALHKFKTFAEYKAKVEEYNKTKSVDALLIIGWFKFRLDDPSKFAEQMDVAKWTTENNKLPEMSFWIDRVVKGNLCSVSVSPMEQGFAAGKIAHAILTQNKAPSSFPFEPTMKGQAVVNLERAKQLGVHVSSDILLMAQPVQKYEWQP